MTPRFAIVELVVDDMARSLAFYRSLGLELAADLDSEPHAEAVLPGGVKLAWDTVATVLSYDPSYVKPVGSAISLGFECDSPADVDAVHAALTASGHASRHDPWDAFWGQRYATVTDPDGYGVDLFAAL